MCIQPALQTVIKANVDVNPVDMYDASITSAWPFFGTVG